MSLMNSLVPAGQQAAQAAAGIGQIPGLGETTFRLPDPYNCRLSNNPALLPGALLNGIPSLRNLPLAPGVGGVPAGGMVGDYSNHN